MNFFRPSVFGYPARPPLSLPPPYTPLEVGPLVIPGQKHGTSGGKELVLLSKTLTIMSSIHSQLELLTRSVYSTALYTNTTN